MGFRVLKLYGLACLWVLVALGVYVGVFFKMRPTVQIHAEQTPPPKAPIPLDTKTETHTKTETQSLEPTTPQPPPSRHATT
ncbi:hypothetical protein, partial [Helicobacter vulpis]|uniref:hypothetical protein n=1 Tax=Helicobacter vulpis TaxID=2316076 RepID=UPI0019699C61